MLFKAQKKSKPKSKLAVRAIYIFSWLIKRSLYKNILEESKLRIKSYKKSEIISNFFDRWSICIGKKR